MLRQPVTSTVTTLRVPADLRQWATRFEGVHVDLGTGDGAFAIQLARRHPELAVVAVDTNLDHLAGSARRRPDNVRFVRFDALGWPLGVLPRADTVSGNFPYGSLLRGLVEGDPALIVRLDALLGRGSRLDVRVNESALLATGLDPMGGPKAIVETLRDIEGVRARLQELGRSELRTFPSSWSKRLGYGKETTAHLIAATR
ncbi:MAG: class I SAM-dependent methyltransferase [Chloroflexota bacterium]|nr:class I SAM-dependent methyltransferase [Chloroflexota bacterium]